MYAIILSENQQNCYNISLKSNDMGYNIYENGMTYNNVREYQTLNMSKNV